MEINYQIKILEFLNNLTINTKDINDNFRPQKLPLKATDIKGALTEVLPEQAGVYSEALTELYKKISDADGISPHSMLVLRNGKLISKAEWAPFKMDQPHISHSLCKSIVSMAVGIAVSEGLMSLDETLGESFSEYTCMSQDMKSITVRHMLTMTSGASFNEAGAVIEKDWVRAFLSSAVKSQPGSEFLYNSMNTYMLTVMICRKTNMSLSDYLNLNLFKPMGITNYFWELCPKGYEKGCSGLYMSIFDYAKLGQLYLQNGIWNGIQLVPKKWVEESVSKRIKKNNNVCYNGYGYHVWRTKNNDGYVFSGMFGQGVYVFPKQKIVIAITAGSSNVFPNCKTMDIISGYIANDMNFSNQPINDKHSFIHTAALRKGLERLNYGEPMYLRSTLSMLHMMRFSLIKNEREEIPAAAKLLVGRRIIFESNKNGLLPILIQVMNGNFDNGIEQIYFNIKDDVFITSVFGNGITTSIPIGFDNRILYFDLIRKGESYHVGTRGWLTTDEDGNPVLKIMLAFIETSCVKYIKLFLYDNEVKMRLTESPELYDAFNEVLRHTIPNINSVDQQTITALLESDIAKYKIKNLLEPEIKGSFTPGEPPRKIKFMR